MLLALSAPRPKIRTQPCELRCPRCFAKDVVPSLPSGVIDRTFLKLGLIPRHCRVCGKRFWVTAKRVNRATA
jgi:transcription elongation factor Elf1